jgi:hypothetical protein
MHVRDHRLELLIPQLPGAARPGARGVVGGGGDPQAVLGKHPADRLDSPAQTAVAMVLVCVDEGHQRGCGRSSSAPKKAAAALRISLARRSRLTSADSCNVIPGRCPPSQPCRTHVRSVSADTPIFAATGSIAAHSDR